MRRGNWTIVGLCLLLGLSACKPKEKEPAPHNPYGDLQSGPTITTTPPAPEAPPKQQPQTKPPEPKPAPEPAPKPKSETAPSQPKGIPALPEDFMPPQPASPAPVKLSGPLPTHPDGWYELGQNYRQAGEHRKAATAFAQAAALNPTAANWLALADEYAALGQYASATRAYDRAATQYRKGGDDMTARALEYKAAPFRQSVKLMLLAPKSVPTQPTLAKFEPARGVMLGIHVAGTGVIGNWGKPARLTSPFQPFAVAFRYWKFTSSTDETQIFPGCFAGAVRANGAALHLALEPGMPLGQITDDMIVRFARAAKKADLPIFVRFASEMNDPQNEWSRDPALYRRTFARVARLLRQNAPNVAMVWMPMPGDLTKIAEYYPGAQSVDWAGLSLYSVPFENGDLSKPRLNAHPLEVIDGFYRQYAPKHPIQLSEYAASHRSGAAPTQDFSAFAAQQLREVYWGALMNYPRLKNINWLDIDMHTDPLVRQGQQERRNDYRLFNADGKWRAFGRLRREDTFYTTWKGAQCRTCTVKTPVPWPTRLSGSGIVGQLWLQTATPPSRVKLLLNGQEIEVEQTLPYQFALPELMSGKHLLTFRAYDGGGKLLLEEQKLFVAK